MLRGDIRWAVSSMREPVAMVRKLGGPVLAVAGVDTSYRDRKRSCCTWFMTVMPTAKANALSQMHPRIVQRTQQGPARNRGKLEGARVYASPPCHSRRALRHRRRSQSRRRRQSPTLRPLGGLVDSPSALFSPLLLSCASAAPSSPTVSGLVPEPVALCSASDASGAARRVADEMRCRIAETRGADPKFVIAACSSADVP
jgi:hypothetical protein